MNRSETARLLATISSFNNRTIGEGDVIAWQSVLSDVELPDAEEAVRRHFAENTEWLMPAHIRRLVRDIVREREAAANPWAAGQHGVPKAQAPPELPHGERLTAGDISPRVVELLSQLRAELPDAPREKLFPRQAAWERQQAAYRRAETATPNPLYKPQPGTAECPPSCECRLHPIVVPDPLGDLPMPTAVRGGIKFGPPPVHAGPCWSDCDRPEHTADASGLGRRRDLEKLGRSICRNSGPHDDGKHVEICPDAELPPEAYDVAGTHRHRASCHGEAGELICGSEG